MSTPSHNALSLIDEILCTATAVGLVLVLLLPAARGMSAIGWLPMWLVGMPAMAWWTLRSVVLPRSAARPVPRPEARTTRRGTTQPRRSTRPPHRPEARHAA